jgi:hypothetical protein
MFKVSQLLAILNIEKINNIIIGASNISDIYFTFLKSSPK